MSDKIKDFWKDKTDEEIDAAFRTSTNIIMAVEFLCTIGIYFFLKHYTALHWAELWMLVVYGYLLKRNVDLVEPIARKKMEEKIGRNESKEDKYEEEQISGKESTKA